MRTSWLVVPCAVTSVALLLSAPALGAPRDAQFFRQLDRDGITYTDPFAMLEYAHGVCESLDRGVPHLDVVDTVMADHPQLDWDHAASLTISAYLAYCPWHALPGTDEPGGASTGVAYA